MARYSCSYSGVTLSTSTDVRTLQTTATGQGSVIRVYEVYIGGEASSSTVARVRVNRSTVPTGAATNVVPEKLDPASIAAAFTNASVYASSQPTQATNDVLVLAFNAFGGVVRWFPPPDGEIIVGSQGAIAYLSVRSASGTPVVSGHILVEER